MVSKDGNRFLIKLGVLVDIEGEKVRALVFERLNWSMPG